VVMESPLELWVAGLGLAVMTPLPVPVPAWHRMFRRPCLREPRSLDQYLGSESPRGHDGYRDHWDRGGAMFGWVGRIIAALASTAIPVTTVTGVVIWWQRKAPKPKRSFSGLSQPLKSVTQDVALRIDEQADFSRVRSSRQRLSK
jgi:hypothetical protein